jgi:hypothetical protein
MEIGVIIELIGTVGFPIVCVMALGFFVYKLWQQSAAREQALMEELAESREVNAKAIDTIAHYAEKLEIIQQDVNAIKGDITVIAEKVS